MKTVGIIGGLGPETTAKFYLEIINSCYGENKVTRPPILMWSVPLEYQVEEDLITRATGEERYVPYLVDAAKRLEAGGADFLVIPCNSVHIFINEVRSAVEIPVLNIVEETIKFLSQKDIQEVGLLATTATLKHNLYQPKLKKSGIKTVLLNSGYQERLGTIINKLVLSQISEDEKQELLRIIHSFSDDGKMTILLACTDLQLIVLKMAGVEIYDTMKILADATVEKILQNK